MTTDACIAAITKAVGRDLTDDELIDVVETANNILDRRENDFSLDSVEKQIKATADQIRAAALLEKRNAMLNRRALLKLEDYVETNFADMPELGFEAILVGVMKGARQGSRFSTSNVQGELFTKHAMGLIADMEERGLHELFVSGQIDEHIYKAIHEIDAEAPNLDNIPDEAVQIAKIIRKYNESLRRLANSYGADIGKISGYLVKQTHDAGRILRDRTGWYDFMGENLDWDRSFPDTVGDPKARKKILDDLYVSLSSGVHLASKADAVSTGFKGMANIGKKMSHERVLHFKDATAEYKYAREYGAGKLTEGVIYGIEKMAQDTGILMQLGPNAENNLNRLKESLLKKVKAEGNPEKLAKVNKKIDRAMNTFWPQVNGLARVPGNAILADVSQTTRAVQMWSKLGGAMLSSVADIPAYAADVRYGGGTMLSGMGEAVESVITSVPAKDQARMGAALSVFHDGLLSATTKRFDATDSRAGKTSAITSVFFKMTGLRWFTDQLRTGYARARAHELTFFKDIAWDGLSEGKKRTLGLYGIDADSWGVVKQGISEGADGRAYMTPEAVAELPDEVFAAYLEKRGDKATKRSIYDARNEIESQFRTYFYDRAMTAVLEPDAKTRGYLFGDTRPGTVDGELRRHIMLFKSFTATVIQKPLAREVYGYGATSLREAAANRNGEMVGLANFIAWNVAFGYLAMTSKDLVKGRTPRDPRDWQTFLAAAAQGGGFGIYGDFLFGDLKNRYGGSATSTLLGPTAGTFDSLINITQKWRDGEDAAAEAYRTLINHTPFINLFYTKWALDYLILSNMAEAMSPGYIRRMEKRLKEQNGQEMLLPLAI